MPLYWAAILAAQACAFGSGVQDKELVSGAAITPLDAIYGPAAALMFARQFRGDVYLPDVLHCYPNAAGVPFSECRNIVSMTSDLWTPWQISADFRGRMVKMPVDRRKKGIIVVLKTERCATTSLRACTVTTAALEKRSTPLASEFLIYGIQLKPRDHDDPPGSLKIEIGADAWKNDAAGQYNFEQGPGATLVFLDPSDGSRIERIDALSLRLDEEEFLKNKGQTPELHAKLAEILEKLRHRSVRQGS